MIAVHKQTACTHSSGHHSNAKDGLIIKSDHVFCSEQHVADWLIDSRVNRMDGGYWQVNGRELLLKLVESLLKPALIHCFCYCFVFFVFVIGLVVQLVKNFHCTTACCAQKRNKTKKNTSSWGGRTKPVILTPKFAAVRWQMQKHLTEIRGNRAGQILFVVLWLQAEVPLTACTLPKDCVFFFKKKNIFKNTGSNRRFCLFVAASTCLDLRWEQEMLEFGAVMPSVDTADVEHYTGTDVEAALQGCGVTTVVDTEWTLKQWRMLFHLIMSFCFLECVFQHWKPCMEKKYNYWVDGGWLSLTVGRQLSLLLMMMPHEGDCATVLCKPMFLSHIQHHTFAVM